MATSAGILSCFYIKDSSIDRSIYLSLVGVQPIASAEVVLWEQGVAFVIVVVGHQEEGHRKGLIESRSGVPSFHMASS